MKKWILFSSLFFLIWCGTCSFSFADQVTQIHWGTAYNESGQIAYHEKHVLTKKHGKTTKSETFYYNEDKSKVIAKLKSDYSKSLLLPTYEFVDYVNDYREGLKQVNGKYYAFYQKSNEKEKSEPLTDTDKVFSCQGWHYYLVENLSLVEKQDLKIKLLLPSELDFYSFKLEQVDSSGKNIEISLSLSNWFLRIFAPQLRLVYNKESSKLIEYKGISNILDKDGDRQDVRIVYDYDKKG